MTEVQSSIKYPVFAVVGHPNKGKSSIVATLAHDESVEISPRPGTTTRCREYPMRVDGEVLYTLVDTPGFQRARRAFAWMQAHERDAASRAAVVAEFVAAHRDSGEFPDECELLRPIIAGAGILYVVDGSRPYGKEYEAEMEILRWTGRPSMALINLIGPGRYVEPWRQALGQFFSVVRIFDAWAAPFERQVSLLRAFGELQDQWRPALQRAVAHLEARWQQLRGLAAQIIASMLVDMMMLQINEPIPEGGAEQSYREPLFQELLSRLRERERHAREQVESLYGHQRAQRDEADFKLLQSDLFSMQSWSLFGLKRRQLLAAGALAGAAFGGGLDLALGGSSLLLGSAVGSVLGGLSCWLGHGRLARYKIRGSTMGGKRLQVGPITNANFPFVLLGRALHHHALISRRSHARRDTVRVSERSGYAASAWPAQTRRRLVSLCTELRRGDADRGRAVRQIQALVSSLMDSVEPVEYDGEEHKE
jgi:hypothetical protein